MHITELPGDYSCGSFGKEALAFIDLLAACGFSYWQTLPFCLADECNSPYKSYSAFAGNPYFIDLPTLFDEGLIDRGELDGARSHTPYTCEYERLAKERLPLLRAASSRVKDRDAVLDFISGEPELARFCEFMTLKDANGGRPWYEWTVKKGDPDDLFMWQFIEYEFFTQWQRVKDHAHAKKIEIIGDIPIYVSLDSCDVWAHKDQFLIDRHGKASCVAGVPPDYFAKDGQLWGNPIYDWKRMAADDFAWWRSRMRQNLSIFDGVRIDHFRGLSSYWSIPGTAETAKEGKWMKGPGEPFVDMLKQEAGERLIIAEDLGDIDEDVVKLVSYSGFPGMRVFQFGFFGDPDSPHRPHSYVNNCVAYTGTHDNNTLLGYVWEMPEEQRRFMLDYCLFGGGDWNSVYPNIIRMMFASAAGIVMFPIQDLLGFGSDTRLNVPGRSTGNWEFRTVQAQLDSIDRNKYAALNKTYSRGL